MLPPGALGRRGGLLGLLRAPGGVLVLQARVPRRLALPALPLGALLGGRARPLRRALRLLGRHHPRRHPLVVPLARVPHSPLLHLLLVVVLHRLFVLVLLPLEVEQDVDRPPPQVLKGLVADHLMQGLESLGLDLVVVLPPILHEGHPYVRVQRNALQVDLATSLPVRPVHLIQHQLHEVPGVPDLNLLEPVRPEHGVLHDLYGLLLKGLDRLPRLPLLLQLLQALLVGLAQPMQLLQPRPLLGVVLQVRSHQLEGAVRNVVLWGRGVELLDLLKAGTAHPVENGLRSQSLLDHLRLRQRVCLADLRDGRLELGGAARPRVPLLPLRLLRRLSTSPGTVRRHHHHLLRGDAALARGCREEGVRVAHAPLARQPIVSGPVRLRGHHHLWRVRRKPPLLRRGGVLLLHVLLHVIRGVVRRREPWYHRGGRPERGRRHVSEPERVAVVPHHHLRPLLEGIVARHLPLRLAPTPPLPPRLL